MSDNPESQPPTQTPPQPIITINQIAAELRAQLDQLAAAGNSGQPPNFQTVFLSQLYSQYLISLIPEQLARFEQNLAEITTQLYKIGTSLSSVLKFIISWRQKNEQHE